MLINASLPRAMATARTNHFDDPQRFQYFDQAADLLFVPRRLNDQGIRGDVYDARAEDIHHLDYLSAIFR
jgi:hypothetical protein